MRKLIALLIVCILVLSGCGDSKEDFSVDGLEPTEQIEAIVNHYVEEEVWHGEITDLQINKDADGEGYVCLVNVDWDLQNDSDNARGVLQTYADELCKELAENGNTSKFVIFFNAIQQGGLYKRGYDITNGNAEVTDTVDQL